MAFPAPLPELHLRGLTVDEALYRLDGYLDGAFMAGHARVRLIHGKGTGAIRKAIWRQLAEHTLVKSYSLASQGEGGAGVTVAELESIDPTKEDTIR